MAKNLEITEQNGWRIIRFTRPEIRNPLSSMVLEQIEEAVNALSDDSRVHSLIFTGTDDVFASGADLREIATVSASAAPAFARRGQRLMSAIAALSQNTIAAINGYCFGGALDLALACDLRIASPDARFAHPGARLGIITGWGGTQRLPRLIGSAPASEMFFSAEPINAARAYYLGLVDSIEADPLAAALARGQN